MVTETIPVEPAAPVAPADPAAVDVVTLRDGSVIRGTISEVFPERQVTIISAAGDRHTFAWAEVADLRYAGPAAAPVIGPGRPQLHIESSKPRQVRLYEVQGTALVTPGMSWGHHAQAQQVRPVCTAPCDRVIDGTYGQSFFFGGEGVTPSRRFTLDEHDGPMTARVRPGRPGVLVGGILLTSMSIAPLISGSIFVSLSEGPTTIRTRNTGITLSAVGASMLISGIIMVALGRTRVELYRRLTGAAQRRPAPAR